MDQTGSPFIIDDGKTYDSKGSKDAWCKSGQPGLDKRQCTVELTVFADGVPRINLLLIFRGKGLRMKNTEKQQWDRRVHVASNAWCDEDVMVKWVKDDWGSYFQNPPAPSSDGKLLIAGIHRAQQTNQVKTLLGRCKGQLVNIPGGLTGYVQVLDVIVNKPLKHTSRCYLKNTRMRMYRIM